MCRTSKNIISTYINVDRKTVYVRKCTSCGTEFETTNRDTMCYECKKKKYYKNRSSRKKIADCDKKGSFIYLIMPKESELVEAEYPCYYVGETVGLYNRINKHYNYLTQGTQILRDQYNLTHDEYYFCCIDLKELGFEDDSVRKYLESWLINQLQPIGNTKTNVNHKPKNIELRVELQRALEQAPIYIVNDCRKSDEVLNWNIGDLIKKVKEFNSNNGVA